MAEMIVTGVFALLGIFIGGLTCLLGVAAGKTSSRKDNDK